MRVLAFHNVVVLYCKPEIALLSCGALEPLDHALCLVNEYYAGLKLIGHVGAYLSLWALATFKTSNWDMTPYLISQLKSKCHYLLD